MLVLSVGMKDVHPVQGNLSEKGCEGGGPETNIKDTLSNLLNDKCGKKKVGGERREVF